MSVIEPVASPACADTVATRDRALSVGLGFRRGITAGQIDAAVRAALAPYSIADITCVATLDTKAREPALMSFCEHHNVPLVTFSAADVEACLREHPSLRRSPVARQHLGVEGVCEPCALLGASGGALLRNKCALDGVTVAIAAPGTRECTQ